MGLNINFTSATLGPDEDGQQRLTVKGRSIPIAGITDIHAVIPHGDGVMTSKVVRGKLLEDWEVRFPPDGAPPFAAPFEDPEVFVVGIAMRETCDPLVWQGGLTVETTT